jgi:hypothetical protein
MGVGLYVVHEIVRLHGGTITAQSTPGGGSSFFVALPIPSAYTARLRYPMPRGIHLASYLPVWLIDAQD